MRSTRFISLVMALPLLAAAAEHGLVKSEFIYEQAPFPQCHASTLCEANGQLIAAWFGGTRERAQDVEIWTARYEDGKWTTPVSVATGVDGERRFPTWNPVLFQPRGEPLTLFYKVGPSPSEWWGMKKISRDGGRSWSAGERLPKEILGPIKNKPVQLASGELIAGSSTEHASWRVHFERSVDGGKTWQRTSDIVDPKPFQAIQPAILIHTNGRLQALCRSDADKVVETWSDDRGVTWTELRATSLPNPNAGLDAVTLRDGRHLVIYNHSKRERTPLNLAVSRDGKDWKPALVLETAPGEYSYPAIIQTSDGLVHATYTWKRQRVKHVVIDPKQIASRD